MDWFIRILESLVKRFVLKDQQALARAGLFMIFEQAQQVKKRAWIEALQLDFESIYRCCGIDWRIRLFDSSNEVLISDFEQIVHNKISCLYHNFSDADEGQLMNAFQIMEIEIANKIDELFVQLKWPKGFALAKSTDSTLVVSYDSFSNLLYGYYGCVLHDKLLYFVNHKEKTLVGHEPKSRRVNYLIEHINEIPDDEPRLATIRQGYLINDLFGVSYHMTLNNSSNAISQDESRSLINKMCRKAHTQIMEETGQLSLETKLGVLSKLMAVLSMQYRWSARAFSFALLGLMIIYIKQDDDITVYTGDFESSLIMKYFSSTQVPQSQLAARPLDQQSYYLIRNFCTYSNLLIGCQNTSDSLAVFLDAEKWALSMIDLNSTISIGRLGLHCRANCDNATLNALLEECKPFEDFYLQAQSCFEKRPHSNPFWKPFVAEKPGSFSSCQAAECSVGALPP